MANLRATRWASNRSSMDVCNSPSMVAVSNAATAETSLAVTSRRRTPRSSRAVSCDRDSR